MKIAGALLLLAGILELLADEFSRRASALPAGAGALDGLLGALARLEIPIEVGGTTLAIGLGLLLCAPRRSSRHRRLRFHRRTASPDPWFLRTWR